MPKTVIWNFYKLWFLVLKPINTSLKFKLLHVCKNKKKLISHKKAMTLKSKPN